MGKNNIFLVLNFFISLALLASLSLLWYRMGKVEGRLAETQPPAVMAPTPPPQTAQPVIVEQSNENPRPNNVRIGETENQNSSYVPNPVEQGPAGIGWGLVTNNAGYGARFGTVPLVFKDRLFAVGGEGTNSVWESSDGINWTQAASPFFVQSLCYGAAVFQDRLWAIGGGVNGTVASSADGIHWDLVTDHPPFGPRNQITLTAFNNRLWMIGGTSRGGIMDDVWYSDNGKDWNCALPQAPFPGRRAHGAVVFDGKLWITGGIHDSVQTPLDDIWNTSDGFHWQQVDAGPHYEGRHSFGFVAYEDKLWITAGDNGRKWGGVSDVWNSADGIHWSCVNPNAGRVFTGRTGNTAFVYKNRIWILGGYGTSIWCSPSLETDASNE